VEFLPLGAVATIAALGIALGNADLLSRAGSLLAVLIVAYIVIDVAVRPVAPGSQSADT
jgi:hypothetical protein